MRTTLHRRRAVLPVVASALAAAIAASCSLHDYAEVSMTHVHHTIDYIEFTVTDLTDAKRFYGEAFGWTFTDYGPDYCGIQRPGGGEVGGMRSDQPVTPGGALVILYSKDLEASVAAVRAAGGEIAAEIFAFPGGRRFEFTDPSGNRVGVWAEG